MPIIKIALEGVPKDYTSSLLPTVINQMGYQTEWVSSNQSDLIIRGPFFKKAKPFKMVPKPLRPMASKVVDHIKNKRKQAPITLFHTQENARHDIFETDYSISFDLGVFNPNHYRLPYWMEMVDWSHEGVIGNQNPRYGRLMNLKDLSSPLGKKFISRPQRMAFITSHLLEPRKMLFDRLSKVIPIDGFGPYFDKNIRSHLQSSFTKYELLQDYAFNLCPENSLYPGYITEKIPEAFNAGCLPITWADTNILCDFNPLAMLNLLPLTHENFSSFAQIIHSKQQLDNFSEQALLIHQPSLDPFKVFLHEVLRLATS